MQKSTSKSGRDTRSGFSRRSNNRSYLSGSSSVMPRQNATSEAGPEPRHPTGTVVVTGPGHEFLDNQEIAREPHLGDDAQFVVEALLVGLLVHLAVTRQRVEVVPQSFVARGLSRATTSRRRVQRRSAARGRVGLAEHHLQAAALGDLQRYSPGLPAGPRTVRPSPPVTADTARRCSAVPGVGRSVLASFLDTYPGLMGLEVVRIGESGPRCWPRHGYAHALAARVTASATNPSSPWRPVRTASR